jgi:DNA polymerase V
MDTNPFYSATEFEGNNAERGIDLNEHLIKNKPATYFMRVNGNAMIGAGIHSGDVVIVDRSIEAKSGKIIIALVNEEMLIRRLQILPDKKVRLLPETKNLAPIEIDALSNFSVWGVVTYVIHIV